MSTIGGTADIEAMLQEIGKTGSLPPPFAADPGSFFLAVHQQWVKNGGKLDGKNRNSVRQLSDLLEADGARVPSLTQKLKGETRLKVDDARALLSVYFSRWRFETKEGESRSGYRPLMTSNSEKTHNAIVSFLFGGQPTILLPKAERTERKRPRDASTENADSTVFLAGRDINFENFKISKAFIHFSRIGTVVGPTTTAAIRRFFEIIDGYWKIAQDDEIDRQLIWVVDPGDRDIDSDGSLAALANAEQLATFFRTIRLLEDPHAEARWSWLSEHATVLIGSMDVAVTDRLYAPFSHSLATRAANIDVIRRGIKHGHFLLETPPPGWLRSPQFALLYGQGLEELERSSFLLCLDEAETRWRYFGYAPAKEPIFTKDGKESFAKYLELESPGPVFDQVASIIHAAACFRLGSKSQNLSIGEQQRSILILKHLDFAVLRLSEFLNAETLSRSPP